ncbi:MAG: hypothetical protein CK538_01735 [Opitutia bacterium]|nr:hypothetical protein [Opitutaceae bacterium]PHX86799.1 MAG: hypothetical protein CK538_01735 [Opitutae bacterium]
MTQLLNEYGWGKFKIRRTYYLLGQACWIVLGLTWASFFLRLDRVIATLTAAMPSRDEDRA